MLWCSIILFSSGVVWDKVLQQADTFDCSNLLNKAVSSRFIHDNQPHPTVCVFVCVCLNALNVYQRASVCVCVGGVSPKGRYQVDHPAFEANSINTVYKNVPLFQEY